MDEDDDILQLPADTLSLLQQFNSEKAQRHQQFESLKDQAENEYQNGTRKLSMDIFGEDWNASQFWYTDDTARRLAYQLLEGVNENSAIAVVSAPSVYVQIRNILSDRATETKPQICLLEYDRRFEVLGKDFVLYDFQHPLSLPAELRGKFDRIICDPPFLSEDCQTKTALTVRYLSRRWAPPDDSSVSLRFITCTGERMEPVISKLYNTIGVKTTTFEPKHSKGLSNEFWCYANFECDDWNWRILDSPV
ncbi:Protein-lysine N-methyltransferase efm5 [Vermiconidia calcicola]|uniref:Protein-lysine N-methyltransferase efm5 n=1 Tax=Vermiconidia calcicola TaxID=1690605 RepID=A0ACC3N364_9PEZI|nr:Protein-lysine N-methyltransferase efm5 [Vermiconidia calcicola]